MVGFHPLGVGFCHIKLGIRFVLASLLKIPRQRFTLCEGDLVLALRFR